MLDKAITALEVAGTAFGIGVLHGRQGNVPAIAKIPLDLGLGVGLTLAGFLLDEKIGDHLINVGLGALTYYAGSKGGAVGQNMRKNMKDAAGQPVWKNAYVEGRSITAGLPARPVEMSASDLRARAYGYAA
jgi:hypothetical protein